MNKLATRAKGNLHSNSWKAVLVLYCLKTHDNDFFDLEGKRASLREKLSCDYFITKLSCWLETMIFIIASFHANRRKQTHKIAG